MLKIPLYKQDGTQAGDITVKESIFGAPIKPTLVHKVLTVQMGNKRHPIAHTMTKGEVRGGGKKPYRQKHTGQARQGSITNPHFRGGGVALGPRNTRNFKARLTQKERRAAVLSVLSDKLAEKHIAALEGYQTEKPKTKLFAQMMTKLPFKKKVLFVLPEKNSLVTTSCRNIPSVKTIIVNYLTVEELLRYQDIVFFKDSIKKLEALFE